MTLLIKSDPSVILSHLIEGLQMDAQMKVSDWLTVITLNRMARKMPHGRTHQQN